MTTMGNKQDKSQQLKPEPRREQCKECKRINYHATFCPELDFEPARRI